MGLGRLVSSLRRVWSGGGLGMSRAAGIEHQHWHLGFPEEIGQNRSGHILDVLRDGGIFERQIAMLTRAEVTIDQPLPPAPSTSGLSKDAMPIEVEHVVRFPSVL